MSGTFSRRALSTFFALVLASSAAGVGAQGPGPTADRPAAAIAYTVTLITGDVVEVASGAAGLEAATVAAAPRGDGLPEPSFQITRTGDDLFAVPSDAALYLDTKLDRELFNVSELIEQGLHDAATESLPLIVDYSGSVGAAPPAMTTQLTLDSIDARAVHESKAAAASFGQAVAEQARRDAANARAGGRIGGAAAAGPLAGIERIWLDGRVEVTLEDSVPHIGAPTAWDAGYDGSGVQVAVLDTGVDAGHPDLAGKVVAAENFTTTADATDHHGHGTHVASTVAGSGAASDGLRVGVAPGASILNGKVLDDNGFGLDSWVIAGMEWAATQGADIVNMSLGAGPTDGQDPLSQAVNALTAEHGTLFAIAAGNLGPGASTVASPGAADAALTVGNFDKTDALAFLSSRGPRVGDYAIKPEITAPGTDIGAARAAGTSLGNPIDDFYTRLSGTSMATPHVAGAAALLAQRNPDWTPEQLKAALVGTASPGDYTVYEQGGGRLDVARAFTQPAVLATPATVNLGYFPWPHDDDEPVTVEVTYTNAADDPVTLSLDVGATDEDGTPAPDGMLSVSPDSISLDPGATQVVEVTLDTQAGDVGLYGGYLVAEDATGDTVVRTPVGFFNEPEMFNLTVEGLARDGRPAGGISWVDVIDAVDTTALNERQGFTDGAATFRVPPGTYSVMGMLFTYDEPHVFAEEVAVVGDPELVVDADTTITLDAALATEATVTAKDPTETRSLLIGTYRAGASLGSAENLLLAGSPIDRAFAAPTDPVTMGDFGLRIKPTLMAPELTVSLSRPKRTLDTRYAFGSARFDGTARLPLVYVGLGAASDYEGLDVAGKAVLISRGEFTFAEKVANAEAAGAAFAIIHNNVPGLLLIGLAGSSIPVVATSLTEGLELQALLAQGARTLDLKGVAVSPYVYDAMIAERGRIAETHTLHLTRSNTAQIAAEYRGHVDGWLAGEAHHAYPAWSGFSFEGVRNLTTPFARTEYVSTGDSRWWHLGWASMDNEHIFLGSLQDLIRTYPGATRRSDAWFGQPQRPNVRKAVEVGDGGTPVVRTGNTLSFSIPPFTDDQGRYGFADSRTDTGAFRLYEDDALIATGDGAFGSVEVSGDPATYRAEHDVTRTAPFWALSTETHTAWTFASSAPPEGVTESVPLLVVDYELGGLDELNRARRGAYSVGLSIQRQQGAPPAAIAGVEAWASFDDGASWASVRVVKRGGSWTALVQNPSAGYVSLRVRAADVDGSVVDQTIIRAYGIR
jgi:subtilisin family serine protease